MTLQQIKDELSDLDISGCLTIQCEIYTDIPKVITSHIAYLESNPKNKAYLPYYNRLLNIVTHLKTRS